MHECLQAKLVSGNDEVGHAMNLPHTLPQVNTPRMSDD